MNIDTDNMLEIVGGMIAIAAVVAFAVTATVVLLLIATLPFALTGWAILMVGSLFTTISISYWMSVAVGFVASLLISVTVKLA